MATINQNTNALLNAAIRNIIESKLITRNELNYKPQRRTSRLPDRREVPLLKRNTMAIARQMFEKRIQQMAHPN